MTSPNNFIIEEDDDSSDDASSEVQTIYGDLVTFIMMLFILLFVLSFNDNATGLFFSQMAEQFGGKETQAQESMTTDAILVSQLQNFIDREKLDEYAQILVDEQKVKLILSTPVLFDSGKAALKPGSFKLLDGLSSVFSGIENPIIAEGHTDSIPINNDEFESNWELSFHRAYSVVKYLISSKKYSPERLSAIGYGEYRPISDNKTAHGRSTNRRLEINIIRLTETNTK
jgi:chemotaxis protein MotB